MNENGMHQWYQMQQRDQGGKNRTPRSVDSVFSRVILYYANIKQQKRRKIEGCQHRDDDRHTS